MTSKAAWGSEGSFKPYKPEGGGKTDGPVKKPKQEGKSASARSDSDPEKMFRSTISSAKKPAAEKAAWGAET